mgnify:CR=1 FL=1
MTDAFRSHDALVGQPIVEAAARNAEQATHPLERLTKPSEQGAASKTVRLYGETTQRSYEGFDRRS